MTRASRISAVSLVICVAMLATSVATLRRIDQLREGAAIQEVLYIPSADTVRRLSLGYSGLMADIYWTRVVQYFGGKHHERSMQYKLLKPLLDITTTLDPQLLVAYEFGSVFLAQQPPEGAGDPEAAAELVQKGIRENPGAWRLYYHLGFIYFQELKDPKRASEAFLKGSEVPGAMPWMKVMAAALAQNAGEAQVARYLWTNVLNDAQDPMLRSNAVKRLQALRVDEEVSVLQQYVDRFTESFGHRPASWQEMILQQFLRAVPTDPLGNPYQLVNGRVLVAKPDELPFITKGLPAGSEPSIFSPIPSKKEQ